MYLTAQNWNWVFDAYSRTIFYPRTNNRPNLHMPGCISQLHARPLSIFSLPHRGGAWELHFPESLAKEENPLFYCGSHRQAGGDWWMVHMRFCQWLPSILLGITLSVETAEVCGGSFSDNLVLLDFLKACRGFPDLCSPSPWNGVVNL